MATFVYRRLACGSGAVHLNMRPPILRSLAVLVGGTGVSQVLIVIATPLIARLYSPEIMGAYGVFLAAANFSIVLAPAGYNYAIVSAKSRQHAASLVLGTFQVVAAVSVLSAVGLSGLTSLGWMGLDSLPWYAGLLGGVAVLAACSVETLRAWFVREEDYDVISRVTMQQGGGRALFPVGLGLLNSGFAGLAVGDVLGRLIGVRALAVRALPRISETVADCTRGHVRDALYEYRSYPYHQVPSKAINTAAQFLPAPMILALFGPSAAGLYVMADRVLGLPSTVIGRAVGDVLHGRMSSDLHTHPQTVSRFLVATATVLTVASAIGLVPLVLYAEDIFEIVLGEDWGSAGRMAVVIAPWAAIRFVISPLSRLVFVYDAQKVKLIYDVTAFAAVAGTALASRRLNLDLMQTLQLLNGLNVMAYLIYGALLIWIVRDHRMPTSGNRG